MVWTKEFWKATAERMARSAAAATVSVLVVGDGVLNVFEGDFRNALGVGLGAALVSGLLAIAGGATSGNGPSFTKDEQLAPHTKV